MRTKNTVKASSANAPRPPAVIVPPPTPDQISQRAKALWESQGRPVGRDEEIWLEAERQLHVSSAGGVSGAGGSPLKEDPEKLERATEKIQQMGGTPRGTEQILR